jgi:chromosome segregation ATPase
MVASPLAAAADELAQCREQVTKCEQVLELADIAINRQAETIEMLTKKNDVLERALREAQPAIDDYGAWYKNRVVWAGAGAVLGIFAYRELRNGR